MINLVTLLRLLGLKLTKPSLFFFGYSYFQTTPPLFKRMFPQCSIKLTPFQNFTSEVSYRSIPLQCCLIMINWINLQATQFKCLILTDLSFNLNSLILQTIICHDVEEQTSKILRTTSCTRKKMTFKQVW